MKIKDTKIKFLFVLLFLTTLLSQNLFAQNSCQNSVSLLDTTIWQVYQSSDSVFWLNYTPSISENSIIISNQYSTPRATFSRLTVYIGTCNNLQLLDLSSGDSLLMFANNQMTVNQPFFLKVELNTPGNFKVSTSRSLLVIHDYNDCLPPCDELIFNGGFESADLKTTVQNVQNNLFYFPFFHKIYDLNGFFGTFDTYQDLVCHWRQIPDFGEFYNNISADLAQIYSGGTSGTPVISGQNCGKIHMSTCGTADTANIGLVSNVRLVAGTTYKLFLYYMISGPSANITGLKVGFSTDSTISYIAQNPKIDYYLNLPYIGPNTWIDTILTFIPPKDYQSLILFPKDTLGPQGVCHLAQVYIDSVSLRPYPPTVQPIISGPTFICPGNISPTIYHIQNYDSVYLYQMTIDGNMSDLRVIHEPYFTINWTNFSTGKHEIALWNWCGRHVIMEVEICCDPFNGLADFYFCHDTIHTDTILGKNISLCDTNFIEGTVMFSSQCDIASAADAMILVLPNSKLYIDSCLVRDGCNDWWKGIRLFDSTAELIVSNSTFEGALSAILAKNNAKVEARNCNFINNQTGISIINYNPDCGMYDPQNPPPDPPVSKTYIAGCHFEVNSSILPVPHVPDFIGVNIKKVYRITIGDDASASLTNSFNNLHYGIKAEFSDLYIFNNEFNNIGRVVDQVHTSYLNIPIEGAIHCQKSLNAFGSGASLSCYIDCFANVGGSGLKKNTFNDCNLGVFMLRYRGKLRYNEFNNMSYSSVTSRLASGETEIYNNNITQKPGVVANNLGQSRLFDNAIYVGKSHATTAGALITVSNNTINKCKWGIHLRNCTSNANRTSSIQTKVGANDIFIDRDEYSLFPNWKFIGIRMENCHRSWVVANDIEQTSSLVENVNSVQGIHISQCNGASIKDNYNIENCDAGIFVVGHCQGTQFYCNYMNGCYNGFYFHPDTIMNGSAGNGIVGTAISQQGCANRATDNRWLNHSSNGLRLEGKLVNPARYWYHRDAFNSNSSYEVIIPQNHALFYPIDPVDETNVGSHCAGQPAPIPYDELGNWIGPIVREEISYEALDDEFEDYDEEALFEILYANPDIMYLGEPDDTAYQNFYNYRTNSTIASFIEIEELIDEGNINQALTENGLVVAQTVIEINRQIVNDIYLSDIENDTFPDSTNYQALLAIAMLTPYVGGEGVYSAREILGITPEDINVAYRLLTFSSVETYEHFFIYPNPARYSITIETKEDVNCNKLMTRLLSSDNRLIQERLIYFDGKKGFLSLDDISTGIYFLQIQCSGMSELKLLIVH